MSAAGIWVRIDPYAFSDEKMHNISGDALKLWLAALCYCNQALGETSSENDGLVGPRMLDHIKVDIGIYDLTNVIAELLDRKLWVIDDECYLIVNYCKYQKSREQMERERREQARRVAMHRSGLAEMVKERDRDACRYCGEPVSFTDRRERGGTYDHVDPRGMNVLDNIVVCCRACQKKKDKRTLKAAKMTLLPAPTEIGRVSSKYLDTPENQVRHGLDPRYDQDSSNPDDTNWKPVRLVSGGLLHTALHPGRKIS